MERGGGVPPRGSESLLASVFFVTKVLLSSVLGLRSIDQTTISGFTGELGSEERRINTAEQENTSRAEGVRQRVAEQPGMYSGDFRLNQQFTNSCKIFQKTLFLYVS